MNRVGLSEIYIENIITEGFLWAIILKNMPQN